MPVGQVKTTNLKQTKNNQKGVPIQTCIKDLSYSTVESQITGSNHQKVCVRLDDGITYCSLHKLSVPLGLDAKIKVVRCVRGMAFPSKKL